LSLSDDFPKIAVDQKAESVADLMKVWPKSRNMLYGFIDAQLKSGAWEKVIKRDHLGRVVAAYRRKKR